MKNMYRAVAMVGSLTTPLVFRLAQAHGCDVMDPNCFLYSFSIQFYANTAQSLWTVNRGGLVVARWLEDLRVWLTDQVFVNAFTSLAKPVQGFFALALLVFWMVFVTSHMVQGLLDLNWVNLRRAMRPILLSLLLFTVGGDVIKGAEQIRLMGGNVLQQTVTGAVAEVGAPAVPVKTDGADVDMPKVEHGIYTATTSCKTPPRTTPTIFLNDYAALYVWADAEDIHCSSWDRLPMAFGTRYFLYGSDMTGTTDAFRQQAQADAADGAGRQGSGLFLMFGAVIEQLVQLIFAVALAIVWFGMLISLIFALFLPTESLFSSQVQAFLAVLRASWLASFMIGLGLAILAVAAASGVGAMVFICGLLLIATVLWQGKQALGILGTSLSAANAVAGNAPGAVGGMLRSWGMTAALVAGTVATGGGMGAALTSVGSTMVRRAGRSLGDNPLSEAAGRVLTNRVADRLDALTQNAQMAKESALDQSALEWYERVQLPKATTPEAWDATQTEMYELAQARTQRDAALRERQAAQARSRKDFRGYHRYQQEAQALQERAAAFGRALAARRGEPDEEDARDGEVPAPSPQPRPQGALLTPAELRRATAQAQEADGDAEQLRTVLLDSAARAVRRHGRRQVQERQASREGEAPERRAPKPNPMPEPTLADAVYGPRARHGADAVRHAADLHALEHEIAGLARQVGELEALRLRATGGEEQKAVGQALDGVRRQLVQAQARLGVLRPASEGLIRVALRPQALDGDSVAVARTSEGLRVQGHAVRRSLVLPDGGQVFQTTGGLVALGPSQAAQLLALPVGQALRLATTPVPAGVVAPPDVPTPAPTGATPAPAAATGTTIPLTPPAGAAPARRGRPGPRFSERQDAPAAPAQARPAAQTHEQTTPTISPEALATAPMPAPAAPTTTPAAPTTTPLGDAPTATVAPADAPPAAPVAPAAPPVAPAVPSGVQVPPTRTQVAPSAPQVAPSSAQVAPSAPQEPPASMPQGPTQSRAAMSEFTLPTVPPSVPPAPPAAPEAPAQPAPRLRRPPTPPERAGDAGPSAPPADPPPAPRRRPPHPRGEGGAS